VDDEGGIAVDKFKGLEEALDAPYLFNCQGQLVDDT
jgi:hypothetical protein